MANRRMRLPQRAERIALFLGFCCFTCGAAFGQASQNQTIPPHQSQESLKETTLRGCLGNGSESPYLVDLSAKFYRLRGNISELKKYDGQEISVLGKRDDSTQPWPSFDVTKLMQVFDRPRPRLSSSFSSVSSWQKESNAKYGTKFAHPESLVAVQDSESFNLQSNFVTDQEVVSLGRFSLGREIYQGTNFVGGSFAISVSPEITNRQSCAEFGRFDPRARSTIQIGTVEYSKMLRVGAAAGTAYTDFHFHTFQNGLCYEIAFELAEFSTGNVDTGCTIPVLDDADEINLMQPLLAEVSYFPPSVETRKESKENAIPRVTEFVASSGTADDINRGEITFKWATHDADYVELSFQCAPAPTRPGIVILEGGFPFDCENVKWHSNPAIPPNRSPNGGATFSFGNSLQDDPISITVILTPFSHGIAYPDSSKSVAIQVDPDNPFPEGVPRANGNIVITYPASTDGTSNYRQGSVMTIHWTDALPHNPCVNLYLVQKNDGGGESFRLQLGRTCFQPSSSGSYAWTIPNQYFGTGYRIFARTPSGASSGLSTPFNIVQPSTRPPGDTTKRDGKPREFVATGNMNTPREFFKATLLNNGSVLVVDGDGSLGDPVPAELYDPAAHTFQPTGVPIAKRYMYTATLLTNGKVLIVGGNSQGPLASAELYDPKTGEFSATGSMNRPRYNHTATLLKSGTVLITGGMKNASYRLVSAELYDPESGKFTLTGRMKFARGMHTATLLTDGTVLIVGGQGRNGSLPARAEVYDPAKGSFVSTGKLISLRCSHTATLLENGEVLIAGGTGSGSRGEMVNAELYNSKKRQFLFTGKMNIARSGHTTTPLKNGRVLIAGGIEPGSGGRLANAELYIPEQGLFIETGPLITARLNHAAAILQDGRVLIVGGAANTVLTSAELY
jgi:galactose oxidase-like protein